MKKILFYSFIFFSLLFLSLSSTTAQKRTTTLKNKLKIERIGTPIDLGLSVLWSSWDLGSSKPEMIGDQYAWGETNPKKRSAKTEYKFYNPETYRYTKYFHYPSDYPEDYSSDLKEHNVRKGAATWNRTTPFEDFGLLDVGEITVVALDSCDDIAQIKWKQGWRMPNCNELKELVTKCKWEWISYNGVEGYKVIGANGNFIFLAADKDEEGGYWSSESPTGYNDNAYGLSFNRFNPIYDRHYRYSIMSVRPVLDYEK